jgi:hypothetical protein
MHRTAAGAWEENGVRAAALEVQKGGRIRTLRTGGNKQNMSILGSIL